MIFKGILLWSTAFIVVIYTGSVDSLIEDSILIFLLATAAVFLLLYVCHKVITLDEFKELSGYSIVTKFFN